ncbi:MAG: hypothetical protein Q8R02_01890 [Hyphomonadaceae bacterium]|nr:hypothetical protein [Hyphomonadaceae bacterium]
MTLSLAWFAIQGLAPDEFLDRAGFEDTGEPDEYFDAEHSAGDLPGGWYVVVTAQAGLLDPARLAQWSAGGRLVAVVVHEDTATSLATEWRDGRQVWSAFHDGSAEKKQLEVEGKLPDIFDAIREDLMAVQAEAVSEGDYFDAGYDIPLDLAEDITGFRHDALGFDEDIPVFNVLERTRIAEA